MDLRFSVFGKELIGINTEKRSEISSLKDPRGWLMKILGGDSFSGVPVNQETASTLGAYVGMLRILSETVAMLPKAIYKKSGDTRKLLDSHPASRLISIKPNPLMNCYTWFETMVVHIVTHGNGYSQIIRDVNYNPIELKFFSVPSDVEPFVFENRLWYRVIGVDRPIPSEDMFHIKGWGYDGIKGKSLLTYAREIIGGGLAAQQLANSTYTSGGLKKLALTHPQSVTPDIQDKIKNEYMEQVGSIEKAIKPVFLQMGLDVKELGFSPEDLQLLSSREFTVSEISRISRVPLHMLASASQTSYNSNEQMAQEFVDYTMMPWFIKFESEINDKLLREDEKGKVYSKFKVNALLRGNTVDRANYYRAAIQNGWYSANRILELEDENPREGGDNYLTPVNMQTNEQLEISLEKSKVELEKLKEPVNTIKDENNKTT